MDSDSVRGDVKINWQYRDRCPTAAGKVGAVGMFVTIIVTIIQICMDNCNASISIKLWLFKLA